MRITLGADLNGHVGRDRRAVDRIHGGWRVLEKNEKGKRVVDFTLAFDMVLLNIFFQMQENSWKVWFSRRNI